MKKIIAFTGAGISKASGIPTFEDMGDLRNNLSRDFFSKNPIEFYELLLNMKNIIDNSKPNNAHIALTKFDIPIITMNIDGLHKKAGSKDIIEIHGNLESVYCKKCNEIYDFNKIKENIYCNNCKSILEPNIVLYGDMIPKYADAIELIEESTDLLVIGTSFYTSTANDFVYIAKRLGINVTIVNEKSEEVLDSVIKKILVQK